MRIALATVGTGGDVRPFRALARRLAARGHEVTAITWPVHTAALALPEVQVRSAGPHAEPSRIAAVAAEASARSPLEQVAILRDFHLEDGEVHYRRLVDLFAGHDLVLLHSVHAIAHAAALDTGVRWATAVFDPVLLPTAKAPPPGLPNLGPVNRLLWAVLDRSLSRAGVPLNGLLQRAGSPQRDLPLFRARSPHLHMVACSPSLMAVPSDLPSTTHVTGAWRETDEPAALPPALEAFLEKGPPPILVTFGSMAGGAGNPVADAVATIGRGGQRVVLQGDAGTPTTDSVFVAPKEVDHRALVPRCGLVVHHGGAGTTHTVAAAGVPSVVVPHIGDQRYWAGRLRALGVAPAPVDVRELGSERFAATVLAAASDAALRVQASRLADRMAGDDGVGRAVELLEDLEEAWRPRQDSNLRPTA